MPWARASELDRLMACPAAGHLPRLVEIGPPSSAAQWGTAMHAWKETGEFPPTDNARTKKAYDDRLAILQSIGQTREGLWPEAGTHERAVALALIDGVPTLDEFVGGTVAERDAWKLAKDHRYVVGTCDYDCGVIERWWVDDLKTGREVPNNPLDLAQMRFYATYFALREKTSILVSLTHWPRSPASSEPTRRFSKKAWSVFDAEEFVETLEKARRAVLRSRGLKVADARPGDHCSYCPASARCPELV